MVFMWLAGCAADLLFRAIPLLAAITAIYMWLRRIPQSQSHETKRRAGVRFLSVNPGNHFIIFASAGPQ